MIAAGGDKILAMRKAGQRPGEGVVVSTVGSLPVQWLVHADLDTPDYDFLWAIDLEVWVVANSRDLPRVDGLLWQFRKHPPSKLMLWVDDEARGYQCWFYPEVATICRPRDEWVWTLEKVGLRKLDNQLMAAVFKGEAA